MKLKKFLILLAVGVLFFGGRLALADENTAATAPGGSPTVSTVNVDAISSNSDDRNVPRVMFWWGKVNQHWDLEKGVWATDADGLSGAREDKMAYCQKFYPKTVKVVEYKKETTNTWRNAYNQGQFTSVKLSYRCVQADESVEQEDVSKRLEKPDSGSICYYYPNLDYCRPFGGTNPGINPPALTKPSESLTSNAVKPIAISAPLPALVKPTTVNSAEKPAAIEPVAVSPTEKVDLLSNQKINQLLEEINQLRNQLKERENEITYLKNLQKGVQPVSTEAKQSINNFITYGVDQNTKDLGTKERAAVVSAYKAAFNKLPANANDLAEAVKIANGENPDQVSASAEAKARAEFKKIYGRDADVNKVEEAGAIKIIAYGLRMVANTRNLAAEKAALKTFAQIYKHTPKNDWEWNIVRAIAYSGVKK